MGVKDDVVNFFKEFYATRRFAKSINVTFCKDVNVFIFLIDLDIFPVIISKGT